MILSCFIQFENNYNNISIVLQCSTMYAFVHKMLHVYLSSMLNGLLKYILACLPFITHKDAL